MPIQAGRSLESYSLNEFKNLAEQSTDTQKLRIRKSNQELTNTPLGFIARYFGNTYTHSNNQVTQAFKHALKNDHKYQSIANNLTNVLEHTALDHHISKLPNGNVLVKVSEKPGTLFKIDYQFEVSPDGMVTLRPESSFTLPSLDKVHAFLQSNGNNAA